MVYLFFSTARLYEVTAQSLPRCTARSCLIIVLRLAAFFSSISFVLHFVLSCCMFLVLPTYLPGSLPYHFVRLYFQYTLLAFDLL